MTTKEEGMSLKQRHAKTDPSGIDKNCSQFRNLNLNQSHQCSKGISHVQSFNKSNTDKRSGHNDFNNFREKGKTWNKSSRSLSLKRSIIQNEAETEKVRKNWKNDKNEGPNKKSNSTLSLHIAAYENFVEAQDSFVDKELKKKGTTTSSKNLEQEPVVSSFNDLLEFPRQQENDPTKPEVQQFTASQRLFTPNQGASSAQMQPLPSGRMYRKPAKSAARGAAANTTLREKLNNTSLYPPRVALGTLQSNATATTQSSHPRGKSAKSAGFSFETENDSPMIEEATESEMDASAMDQSGPDASDINQSDPRVHSNIDPVFELEDAALEADDENFGFEREASAKVNAKTQLQTQRPRVVSEGQAVDGYDGRIFRRLKKLGVEVNTNEDGEIYFYLGELTHKKLLKRINEQWTDEIMITIVKELQAELESNPELWNIFLDPARNINGDQDTIFRALILTKFSQLQVFNCLFRKLSTIATGPRPNEAETELGQKIITHFRCITQVYEVGRIFTIVIENSKLGTWIPDLRDEFIKILPELFIDNSVHSNTARKLLIFMLDEKLENQVSLRSACLAALKVLDIKNTQVGKRIYGILMKGLMKFDIQNLPLVIETCLAISPILENDVFRNFLYDLEKYLNIEKLLADEAQKESTTEVDKYISQLFIPITNFMRLNLSRSEKELLKFYGCAPIRKAYPLDSKKAGARQNYDESNDSDVEDAEEDDGGDVEEEEEEEEEDRENPKDPDYVEVESEKSETTDDDQREFGLIDVLLLICFNEASNSSDLVLKELRKQIAISYDNFNNLKNIFVQAIKFPTLTEEYLGSILVLARNLVQSPNPQIIEFGCVIYRELFLSPFHDRATILKNILEHFGEVDSEASAVLTILSDIVEERVELLRIYVKELNDLIDNLSFISTDNIRKLFYVLVSLNFLPTPTQSTQAQRNQKREGDVFINRLFHYMSSNISSEVIWGVIGLVQYVKVLLAFSKSGMDYNDVIVETLKKVNDACKKSTNGKVRAEFYTQMSQLLKPMAQLGECESLMLFGDGITKYARTQHYRTPSSKMTVKPSTFDSEIYVDASIDKWINLAAIVTKDNEQLTQNTCSLIPLLQLVKDFASYRDSFLDDSDPTKAEYWSSLMFILEANVNLNPIENTTDLTHQEQLLRCNVLYVTIEYLRTVMNMFAECKYEEDKVKLWMEKKLNLMLLCQTHIKSSIEKLNTYTLPRITQINKDDIIVKSKDAKKTKTKKKKPTAPESMDVDDESRGGNDEESRDQSSVLRGNEESNDASRLEYHLKRFALRKKEGPKKITSDQLQWYYTPLRLETVTKLLQLKEQKIKLNLFLIETFHVILKYTLPIRGKQMPLGFGFGSGAQPPIASMDFGSKNTRWGYIDAAIIPLFDNLLKTVNYLQSKSPTQLISVSTFTINAAAQLLKLCVMIFSRIFQSHEISFECDHHDSDRTEQLASRRAKVISTLNRAVSVFNTSKNVQNDLTHNPNASPTVTDENDFDMSRSFIHETLSRNHESLENNDEEGNVIDFFLEVGNYVSSMESASALLALYKTFDERMDDFHKRRCAEAALLFLSKDWAEDAETESLDERNAIIIATDYIHFRQDNQKLAAINWLIWHHLLPLYPNTVLSGSGIEVGNFKDPEEYVQKFEGSPFPCFQKIPQWHKMLFKQFNDHVFKTFKVRTNDTRIHDKQFLNDWANNINTFHALVFVINNSGFRVQNVLLTLMREGKRFISFILSKQSTFSLFIRNRDFMTRNSEKMLKIIRVLEAANKLMYDFLQYSKYKKNAILVKLVPELKAAQERMARNFYDAGAASGIADALKFDFAGAKMFTDEEKKTKTPKKPKSDKPKKSKSAAGSGKKRATKSADGQPAKKRAKKSKDTVEVIDTTFEESLATIGQQVLDATRNGSGYVDDEEEDENMLSD